MITSWVCERIPVGTGPLIRGTVFECDQGTQQCRWVPRNKARQFKYDGERYSGVRCIAVGRPTRNTRGAAGRLIDGRDWVHHHMALERDKAPQSTGVK